MTHYCKVWSPLTRECQTVCGQFFKVGPDGPWGDLLRAVDCQACIQEHDLEIADLEEVCDHLGSACERLGMAGFTEQTSPKDWSPWDPVTTNSQNG